MTTYEMVTALIEKWESEGDSLSMAHAKMVGILSALVEADRLAYHYNLRMGE